MWNLGFGNINHSVERTEKQRIFKLTMSRLPKAVESGQKPKAMKYMGCHNAQQFVGPGQLSPYIYFVFYAVRKNKEK